MTMLAGSAMPGTFSKRGDIICLKIREVAGHRCPPLGIIEPFDDLVRENVPFSIFTICNEQRSPFDFLFGQPYGYDPSHA